MPGTHILVACILLAINLLIFRSVPSTTVPPLRLLVLTRPVALRRITLSIDSCSKKRYCHAVWLSVLLWLVFSPYLSPVLFPAVSQEDEIHFFKTADGARINLSRYRSHNSTG